MEAQPEEEEGSKLRRETATTAEQLRGRFSLISDYYVTQPDTVYTVYEIELYMNVQTIWDILCFCELVIIEINYNIQLLLISHN